MERVAYDRMAEVDAEHWWFAARRDILSRLIEQLRLPNRPRILEIGCGTGSNLEMLQQFGRVDAIEPDGPAAALASRRSGIAVQRGSLPGNAELEDGTYDLIAMLDVLEHIEDDRAALLALKPKLAPGGRLLLTVPAMPWLWSGHDVAHHHHRRYTAVSIERLLRGAGFRIRYRSYFNTLLFPLVVAARGLGMLTGHERDDDALPPAPLNGLLRWLFGLERHMIGRLPLPFGVSLALTAEPANR